jgi:hypothetical protein
MLASQTQGKGDYPMAFMLSLYGSNHNSKLLTKGGQCKGEFLDRQIGGKPVVAITRRKDR